MELCDVHKGKIKRLAIARMGKDGEYVNVCKAHMIPLAKKGYTMSPVLYIIAGDFNEFQILKDYCPDLDLRYIEQLIDLLGLPMGSKVYLYGTAYITKAKWLLDQRVLELIVQKKIIPIAMQFTIQIVGAPYNVSDARESMEYLDIKADAGGH